jgi:hypothetical protein
MGAGPRRSRSTLTWPAICPNWKILLVEASSNSFANLGNAEDYAAGHANVISNSYGGSQFSS